MNCLLLSLWYLLQVFNLKKKQCFVVLPNHRVYIILRIKAKRVKRKTCTGRTAHRGSRGIAILYRH